MKKYNISYIEYSNTDYGKFLYPLWGIQENDSVNELISNIYPVYIVSQGKGTLKHILVLPKHLKKLMMVVDTKNGDIVRSYYIALEELFELYVSYQLKYKSNQLFIKDKKWMK